MNRPAKLLAKCIQSVLVLGKRAIPYIAAMAGLGLLVSACLGLMSALNQTSVALFFVLLVVTVAVAFGRSVALVTAFLAGLAFNYFFLAPIHTFSINHLQDTIAFTVLVMTALIVGQLSARAERRGIQAESRKQELEKVKVDFEREAAEAESLRKSEQLKTALLDAVTHDLRTPLTSIKAAVTTLRSSPLPDESRDELLQVMEEETDRLNHFIQAMVDLAQLEAGSIPLHSTEVTAGEIIEDAVSRAEPALAEHRVEIRVPGDLPTLRADPRLLSQVLFTLLENAAKYAPRETPVDVSAEGVDSSIIFRVTDSGPGIPPEMRQKVFEKFVRGSARPGLGLGLTIARGIVQGHSGSIWIDSGPNGKGTTVSFQVPCSA